jgi:hypothetical protein
LILYNKFLLPNPVLSLFKKINRLAVRKPGKYDPSAFLRVFHFSAPSYNACLDEKYCFPKAGAKINQDKEFKLKEIIPIKRDRKRQKQTKNDGLTDLTMPGMSAIELAGEVKNTAKSVKIIIYTKMKM